MMFSTVHHQGDPAKNAHAQQFVAIDKFAASHPQSIRRIYLLNTPY